MSTAKIAITIDEELLSRLDQWVGEQKLKSRSRAVQEAIREKLERDSRNRLARECRKLDPAFEQELSETGFAEDSEEWPEY